MGQQYYYILKIILNIQPMIDAETSMKNQSFLIEQLSKPQQPLQDSEMNNQQAVRKAIKKYQNKITQMLKVIKSQKSQNQHLKSQLKSLNENLNNVISKLNHKNIAPTLKNDSIKDQVIKRELDNEIKKNVNLQKQLQQLRVKIKGIDSQRVQEMQNQIKEKDKKIQELALSVKMHEKIQRQDKSMDIYKKEEQLVNKVNSLNEEILHLKNKIAKQKKNQQMHQKMMKRQHQQILTLQSKVKPSQPQLNKSMSKQRQQSQPTLAKSDSSTKVGYLKQKYGSPVSSANEGAKGQPSQGENDKNYKSKSKKSQRDTLLEKVSELEERCENLEVTKKAMERHLKFQIQSLKTKNKTLQSQLNDQKAQLKRKDQQANILVSKMKQTQRKNQNYNTLQPMQKLVKLQQLSSNNLFDQRKQYRGLVHSHQGNYRKFDDTESLSLQKNYRIKSFTFSWHEQHILSLETVYQLKQGQQKEVCSFKISHEYKNVKNGSLELSDFQYIKQVELYCGKFIEYIKIQTSRDKVLEIGNYKNITKCKKFQFDIRTNQKPIAFLGAIDSKKVVGVDGNRELLISFGLEIKKKDVVGKNRYNPARTTSLVKSSSKSVLDHAFGRNDKNIIDQQ